MGRVAQKTFNRCQAARRPAVFLHLRVGKNAALGRHGSEPLGVVLVHACNHRPRLVVYNVAQQEGDQTDVGKIRAALALGEKPPAAFAPLGAPGPGIAKALFGPNTVSRTRVVGIAEVADALERNLPEFLFRATGTFLVVFGGIRKRGKDEGRSGRVAAVPVGPAEKMPAVGTVRPIFEIVRGLSAPSFPGCVYNACSAGFPRQARTSAGGWLDISGSIWSLLFGVDIKHSVSRSTFVDTGNEGECEGN